MGHIAEEVYSINEHLTEFFVKAKLITVTPITLDSDNSEWCKKGDTQIGLEQIKTWLLSMWMHW